RPRGSRVADAPRAGVARGAPARPRGPRPQHPVRAGLRVRLARREAAREPAAHAGDARRARARRRDRSRRGAPAPRHHAHTPRRDVAARAARSGGGPMTARESAAPRTASAWQRALPWLVTFVCFTYLYLQIERQAARQGQSAFGLLAHVFSSVHW